MFATLTPLILALPAFQAGSVPQLPSEADLAARYGERWTPEARVFLSAGPSVVSIDVFARIRPSLMRARNPERMRITQGTGVIIDASGLVITNAHVAEPPGIPVVPGSLEFEVSFAEEFEARSLQARLLTLDRESDLALMKIEGPGPFPPIPMGSSADLLIGEPVIAIGTPFGNSHSITSGILSGWHRNVQVGQGSQQRTFQDLLQTDAAINPGNSGGPLLNVYGELVGINFATNLTADNIGFAIPVDTVKEIFANRLLDVDRSDRFWAGMGVTQDEDGLEVSQVHPRGPAWAAGVRPGDRLDAIDGQPTATIEAYASRLLAHQAGDRVELDLRRDGRQRRLEVPLRPARDRDTFGLLGFDARSEWATFTQGRRRELLKVLRVTQVYPATGAERLGIRPGDLLLAVRVKAGSEEDSWKPVRGMAELISVLRGPDFDTTRENVWLLRDEQGLKGRLVLDDPTVVVQG